MEASAQAPVELTGDLLRHLAEARAERGLVLSVYLDLDPAEFATAEARSSAVTSLVDGAGREVEATEGLDHDSHTALREDVERAREALQRVVDGDYAGGARALALFSCAAASMLHVVRLEHPVSNAFRIAGRPWIEPLTQAPRADWCILLIDRRVARVFVGGRGGLRALGAVEDDVHGQHDQGGWSQARYQRSVDQEAHEHFEHAGEVLQRELADRPVGRLLIAGPEESRGEVEASLSRELRERLVGHFHVDVESSNADAVLAAAAPLMEEAERRSVDERLDRLRQGAAHGTGALGLQDVLTALNERAVEALMVQQGYGARGYECPSCGWLVSEEEAPQSCPADGSALERRDDILESAVRLAVEQAAEVMHLSDDRPELRPLGEIAAVLRFAVRPDTAG